MHLAIQAIRNSKDWGPRLSEDLLAIDRICDNLPSLAVRTEIQSRIALACQLSGHASVADVIISKKVLPALRSLDDEDAAEAARTISRSLPSMHLSHPNTFSEQLSMLPPSYADITLSHTVRIILRRVDPREPYEYRSSTARPATYESALSSIQLIAKVRNDSLMYELAGELADSIRAKGSTINENQRRELARQLSEIVDRALPSTIDIKHDGYKIICKSSIERIIGGAEPAWSSLFASADLISNTSDRVFVLTQLASQAPKHSSTRAKDAAERALALVASIPFIDDRLERYQDIAESLTPLFDSIARRSLKLAFDLALNGTSAADKEARRNILDIAHRIAPSLATVLVSSLDDDPARVRVRDELRSNLEVIEARDGLSDAKNLASSSMASLPELSYSQLRSVNSGRAPGGTIDQGRALIERAARSALAASYPTFALAQETVARRAADTDASRKLFFGSCGACNALQQVARRVAGTNPLVTSRTGGFQQARFPP